MCRLELGEGNAGVDLIRHPSTARLSQMSERCNEIEDTIFWATLTAKPRGLYAVPCICICVAFVYDEFLYFGLGRGGGEFEYLNFGLHAEFG